MNAAHRAFAILRAGFAIATALVDLGRWQLEWESLEKQSAKQHVLCKYYPLVMTNIAIENGHL